MDARRRQSWEKGHDGVIADHITSNVAPPSLPAVRRRSLTHSLSCYESSQSAVVMDDPRSGNSPGGISITH